MFRGWMRQVDKNLYEDVSSQPVALNDLIWFDAIKPNKGWKWNLQPSQTQI